MADTTRWDTIIIGGSLTGLMYGVILKRQGRRVCIIEQATSSARSHTAAGIGIRSFGQAFLSKYDRLDTPFSIDVKETSNFDAKGQLRSRIPVSFKLTSWDALYNRLRANFDGVSNGYFTAPDPAPGDGEAVYLQGRRLTHFDVEDDGVRVICDDLNSSTQTDYRCKLLIAADGQNSLVRRILIPEVTLRYSGYVAWRAAVPESQLSFETQQSFNDLRTYVLPNSWGYVVVYPIPGEHGNLEHGHRSINMVWYEKAEQDILVDSDGHRHRTTLPQGKMPESLWAKQVEKAVQGMPAHLREVCEKAQQPFISTVNDFTVQPQASWYNGRVILAGEALLLLRPNTGAGFDTAAYAALQFAQDQDWEINIRRYNRKAAIMAIGYGEYLMFGLSKPSLWWHTLQFLWILLIEQFYRFL